jgi:hypothetical protein
LSKNVQMFGHDSNEYKLRPRGNLKQTKFGEYLVPFSSEFFVLATYKRKE